MHSQTLPALADVISCNMLNSQRSSSWSTLGVNCRCLAIYVYERVLSSSGGCGPSATVALKRLAGLISEKHGQPYSSALAFIRCRLAFSLINSAVAYLRAPRSAYHAAAMEISLSDNPLDLIRAEAQLSD